MLTIQTDKTMIFTTTLHELDNMIIAYAETITNRDACVVNQLISINDYAGTIIINEVNTNSNTPDSIQTPVSKILDDITRQSSVIDDSTALSSVLSNFLENITLKD